MLELTQGSQLGQYEIIDQIGEGGMARIFRARQISLNRDVAIKVLPVYLALDAEYLARFRREANAIAQLQHRNILPVYDFGDQDGLTYIVMMLVRGGQTLKDRLGTPVELGQAVRLVSQVADALAYAHDMGIIHRDIKPSNILLGERDWALLSDFGIARMLQGDTHLTRTGIGIGTPEYMSPEQGQGLPIDGRTDLYSLGVILFHLLTGRLPFEAETPVGTVIQHITKPVPLPTTLNPKILPDVEQVILRAMAKDPNDRYATVGEFRLALESAARSAMSVGRSQQVPVAFEGPTVKTETSGPPADNSTSVLPTAPRVETGAQKRTKSRWPLVLGAAALLGLACVGGGVGLGYSRVSALLLPTASSQLTNVDHTPTPTPTVPSPTATTPAATRTSTPVRSSDIAGEPTQTPTPTETPTNTPTPRPTNTPANAPTNTPAPSQPTNTSVPVQSTPTGGGGGGGGGGSAGRVTIRNTGSATVTCAYVGDAGDGRVEIAPGGSATVSLPPGSYTERCTGGAGGGISSVNVPSGGSVSRTVN